MQTHWRAAFLCVSVMWGPLVAGCGPDPLAPPSSADPLVIEVIGVSLWEQELNAAVAAMDRQLDAAGGVAGRPVELRLSVIGSPAETGAVLTALGERIDADPPFGVVGPVEQPSVAAGLLSYIAERDLPLVYPFPQDEAVFDMLASVPNGFLLSSPPPSYGALAERVTCDSIALVATPNGVGLFQPRIEAAFPDAVIEAFPALSTGQRLVDAVAATNAPCVFNGMLVGEAVEFLDLWSVSGHPDVQWMGGHWLYNAEDTITDPSMLDGAFAISNFYINENREESAEFIAYLRTVDPSLRRQQLGAVAGIYDAIALEVLAAEFLVGSPSTSAVSAIQIVSSPSTTGFDEVTASDMAQGLHRARLQSLDYQGALDALDIDPTTRYPPRRYSLLRYVPEMGFQFETFMGPAE